MKYRPFFWPLFLLAIPLLSGCSPMSGQGQPSVSPTTYPLSAGHSIGQTFTARQDGLVGIELYLQPDKPGDGKIRLRLRANPDLQGDLAAAEIPAQSVDHPGFYRFDLSPQADSGLKDYTCLLEYSGSGSVRVGSGPGNAYLDGALYQDGAPQDAQTAFLLFYSRRLLALGLARWAGETLLRLIVAIFLFVLPGWALMSALWEKWRELYWPEKLGLALGISLAVYPILFLWTDLVGLHLGSLYAWIPVVGAALYLLFRQVRPWRGWPAQFSSGIKTWATSSAFLPDLAFLAIASLVVLLRFYSIRTLTVPMWGDSYHHTMIVQLMIDHGGLFTDWAPYADLHSLTYHFGFHSAVAVFEWLSITATTDAVLWVGQFLNVAAVLVLYPLATKIARNRWAGAAAVLVAGLLTPMPMYYVNWGRYTQLAGQVILPAAILIAWELLSSGPSRRTAWIAGAIAWSGLALTHYRVLILAAIFVPVCLLLNLNVRQLRAQLLKALVLTGSSIILFLPWVFRLLASQHAKIFSNQMSTVTESSLSGTGDLSAYLPVLIWLLILIAIAWGMWRREKAVLIFAVWWLFTLIAGQPGWVHLPGTGVITLFAVLIAFYIPAAVLIGSMAGWIQGQLSTLRYPRFIEIGLTLILLLIASLNVRPRLNDVQVASHSMVTRPDLRAFQWIDQNLPGDAKFLVNTILAYNGTTIAGTDAGWWIPLLAHRDNSVPPMTYNSEIGPLPNYQSWANQPAFSIIDNGLVSEKTLSLLNERGYHYIYIGQQQGSVGQIPPMEPMRLARISTSPHFHLIYQQDRVWIFKIIN